MCDSKSPESDSNLATLDNENVLDDPTLYNDLLTDEYDSFAVGKRCMFCLFGAACDDRWSSKDIR